MRPFWSLRRPSSIAAATLKSPPLKTLTSCCRRWSARPARARLFAVALLASGQNSSITGTLAGQVVMEGFIHIRVSPWLRRLITRSLAIIPTILVVWFMGERGTENLLLLSQVILSLQLSFAVVPLVIFTGNRKRMGEFVNCALAQSVVVVGRRAHRRAERMVPGADGDGQGIDPRHCAPFRWRFSHEIDTNVEASPPLLDRINCD